MSNPDHRVHASLTAFWVAVCLFLLALSVLGCAGLVLDAYRP